MTPMPSRDFHLMSFHFDVQFLPAKMYDILPSKDVPAVFTCKGKEWEMAYHGGRTKGKRFSLEWKRFADDNDLHVGDACVFELMVCTARQLKFHVQILRGDIPPAFQGRICGARSDLRLAVKSEI